MGLFSTQLTKVRLLESDRNKKNSCQFSSPSVNDLASIEPRRRLVEARKLSRIPLTVGKKKSNRSTNNALTRIKTLIQVSLPSHHAMCPYPKASKSMLCGPFLGLDSPVETFFELFSDSLR